jgi:hypothetical protein
MEARLRSAEFRHLAAVSQAASLAMATDRLIVASHRMTLEARNLRDRARMLRSLFRMARLFSGE